VARATGQTTAHKGRSSLTACDRPDADPGSADPARLPDARGLAVGVAAEHLTGPGISLPVTRI